jgi:methionyl-tRNA synthetase
MRFGMGYFHTIFIPSVDNYDNEFLSDKILANSFYLSFYKDCLSKSLVLVVFGSWAKL